MCKSKSPPPPDYKGQSDAQIAAVRAQTQDQYEMDLMSALMSSGKIPAMNVADEKVRDDFMSTIEEMGFDMSNPFPGYIENVGETIFDAINQAEAHYDFPALYAEAEALNADLKANALAGQESLNNIYNGDLEAMLGQNLEAFREFNAANAQLNLDEANLINQNQDDVLASGDALADSVEKVGSETAGLLNEKLGVQDETTDNVLTAQIDGNQNVYDKTIESGDNTAGSIIEGATSVADTAANVAGNIADTASEGLKGISNANLGAIDATKNQTLSGIGSVSDVKTDSLDSTTDVGTTGIGDVANVATAGLEGVRDSEASGIGQIYDADISASKGIFDTSMDNASKLEGGQLEEAGLLGNQMRRTAMTGRRAAEDAYNKSLRGMRGMGIGQGTGSNMRSALAQNRANQAQGMFAPMAQADATQLGMESSARLGRLGSENQANLDFSIDKGLAGSSKARLLADSNNAFASGVAGVNNQESEGLAGIRLADAATRGEINTDEAIGTAGALQDAVSATGANNVNLATGQAGVNNQQATTVGNATNKQAGTIAGANTAKEANAGEAGINQAGADAAANVNAAGQFGENETQYIQSMIDNTIAQQTGKVSANEIRMQNDLRKMGWNDADIAAMRTNLGYDLSEQDMAFNNYQNLMNMQLANLGMNANQASLMKYLNSAPSDMALGGLDAVARYSSPYTQRVLAPAHQSYIDTSPYIPQSQGGGGSSSFLDKFINFSNRYQGLGQ